MQSPLSLACALHLEIRTTVTARPVTCLQRRKLGRNSSMSYLVSLSCVAKFSTTHLGMFSAYFDDGSLRMILDQLQRSFKIPRAIRPLAQIAAPNLN